MIAAECANRCRRDLAVGLNTAGCSAGATAGGAIVSPSAAGWLLDAGWGPGMLHLLVAGVLAAGGLAVLAEDQLPDR